MKLYKILVSIFLIFALLPNYALAMQDAVDTQNIIYYEDGSYLVTETVSMNTRAGFTRNAIRVQTYYNAQDVKQWEATLRATFTYDGTSCTCASSSLFFNILDNAWYVVSEEATKSANIASCEFTMGYRFLGITTTKRTFSMSITCDANGNLS